MDINTNKTIAERLLDQKRFNDQYQCSNNTTRSENLMRKQASNPVPEISNRVIQGVSDQRREMLEMQYEAGEFREKGSYTHGTSRETSGPKMINTQAGVLSHSSSGRYKTATNTGSLTSGTSAGWRGSNDTVRQMGEIYSPLWLNSNLSLPRDRGTINAWSRAFFALNPIVHNAITLHSTYPIAKLSIKSKNEKVEKFFSQMIEEIDLINVCCQAAQEYWVLGEVFVYGELDEAKGRWSRLTILNPDYVNVQRTVSAAEPIISLRPDENLKRVVFGNKPSDLQQKQQLDPSIIEHVKRNENIPLNNFYVSHLARKISPYEIRGTGLITSCFRQLMLFDRLRESKFAQADSMINPTTLIKIGNQDFRPTPVDLENWRNVFECYDDETEVLTNQGFRKFADVINYKEIDGVITETKPKQNIKVACFNCDNNSLEYKEPLKAYVNNYNGEMYHFHSKKLDIKVTPDHDMWVSEKEHENNPKRYSWGSFKKKKAKDLNLNDYNKFRSVTEWDGKKSDFINIGDYSVPSDVYLRFLGYVLSEGCCYTNKKSMFTVGICQKTDRFYEKMKNSIESFSSYVGRGCSDYIDKKRSMWRSSVSGKDVYEHFIENIGVNGSSYSFEKHIPRWVLDLDKTSLEILLDSMLDGDGSRTINGDGSCRNSYSTSSKELANDVQEAVFKCGYSSIVSVYSDKRKNRRPMYKVIWSNNITGNFPVVYKRSRTVKDDGFIYNNNIDKEIYNGKIYCFTVPTGLFVTRRNGKITIQGNSAESDKNFKIFTHDAVTVERIGWGQGIYDTGPDITQLIKEIYIGLMVPSVIMDGSDTTYATGSVALDVLRQRYMQFRQLLTSWLRNKIFAPISQINDFYEYIDGEKTLIVPDVDWNHMSLFDMDSFINNMVNLSQGEGAAKRVSLQTLYRSLGLEYEEEQRKIRYEDIQDAIRMKEMAALSKYSIHELKSLRPGDDIEEVNEPVPGESPFVPGEVGESSGGGGGIPSGGGGLGPMPGSPPSSPVGGGSKSSPKPPAA